MSSQTAEPTMSVDDEFTEAVEKIYNDIYKVLLKNVLKTEGVTTTEQLEKAVRVLQNQGYLQRFGGIFLANEIHKTEKQNRPYIMNTNTTTDSKDKIGHWIAQGTTVAYDPLKPSGPHNVIDQKAADDNCGLRVLSFLVLADIFPEAAHAFATGP